MCLQISGGGGGKGWVTKIGAQTVIIIFLVRLIGKQQKYRVQYEQDEIVALFITPSLGYGAIFE